MVQVAVQDLKKYWPPMTATNPDAMIAHFQSDIFLTRRNTSGTMAAAMIGGTMRAYLIISGRVEAPAIITNAELIS